MLCRNDNHPVFALPEYRRELREGDTEFEPGLVVRTTDRDGPLQGGGTVFYSLQSINTDAPVFQVSKAMRFAIEQINKQYLFICVFRLTR